MRRTMLAAAGMLCGVAIFGAAQAGANKGYSGNWVLELKGRSDRAKVYAGNRLLIGDTGTAWTLKSWHTFLDKEERGWELSGSLDGKSCKVEFDPQAGNKHIGALSCKLYREGDKVVLQLDRNESQTTQRFTHALSGDGQTMTVEYEYIQPSGAGPRHTIDTRGKGGELFKKG